jgi:hypothetical protein
VKRLAALLLFVLAAPAVEAGAPLTTILTDRIPPYLVPASGAPVALGASATETVVLSKGSGVAQLSLLGVVPGSDFQITGGTCTQGVTTFVNPGDSCTIDVRFVPSATGARAGTLTVDCMPLAAPGGIAINCDVNNQTIANLALNGLGALAAALAVPGLGRYEITALALTLFALAGWSLRRKP